MSSYRRDIDGLRAVAVAPVVLYHAGVPLFSGGFVGVDIFFVISGFLITTLLQEEVREGRLSILGFYNRRAHRLFPALFAVLAVTSIVAFMLLLPGDLRRYARSLVGTASFSSNIVFLLETGYFNTGSPEKPLLHTWSLAVEEQFYIVWPLLLWALHRAGVRRDRPAIVVGLTAASFVLCVWLTAKHRDAAFFLSPPRGWELLLGALLALHPLAFKTRLQRELAAGAGLALIAWAVVSFGALTLFPGPAAAAPCIGAALLIAANARGDTTVAKMLSLRPVVFVGLISYSFYLWHWPVLAFAHYWLQTAPSWPLGLALVMGSGLLAVLSWRYVEQPFRRAGKSGKSALTSLGVSALGLGAFLAIGGAAYLQRGWPERADPAVQKLEAFSADAGRALTPCGVEGDVTLQQRPDCFFGNVAHGYDVVVWGDSHASAFEPAIADAARASGYSGREISESGCPPLTAVRVMILDRCAAFNARALDLIGGYRGLKAVVLAGRWASYSEEDPLGGRNPQPTFLLDERNTAPAIATSRRVLELGLDRTVAELRRRLGPSVDIYIVGQTPEPDVHVPQCIARHGWWGRDKTACTRISAEENHRYLGFSNAAIARVAARHGARTFLLSEALCDATTCAMGDARGLYFTDDNHLSPLGARVAGAKFAFGAR